MRRTHLRGHQNILKRLLIHVGAFNLSLIFRTLLGSGTPRELRNRRFSFVFFFFGCLIALQRLRVDQTLLFHRHDSTVVKITAISDTNFVTQEAVVPLRTVRLDSFFDKTHRVNPAVPLGADSTYLHLVSQFKAWPCNLHKSPSELSDSQIDQRT